MAAFGWQLPMYSGLDEDLERTERFMGPFTRMGRVLAKCCFAGWIIGWSASATLAQQPGEKPASRVKKPTASAKKKSRDTYVLVGAGDTAKLIESIPGSVFAAGDLAYQNGTYEEFLKCYEPTWGEFKARTHPVPGNHEYNGSSANGYFRYWGKHAGDPNKGYYSYDLGTWHIVALNTNCDVPQLGGCGEGSPEETWLKQDLAAHPNACILAYGHHARFSSGFFEKHAQHPELTEFWQDLFDAHADLILAGHEHSYERFAPQNPEGDPDPEHGIREIVVGTGGRSHTPLGFAKPNSQVRDDRTYGVLKLTLSPGKYRWEFIPEPGKTFHDSGEGVCHNGVAAAR